MRARHNHYNTNAYVSVYFYYETGVKHINNFCATV